MDEIMKVTGLSLTDIREAVGDRIEGRNGIIAVA